jgi:hypothetical protein
MFDSVTKALTARLARSDREPGVGMRLNRAHTGRSVQVTAEYYAVRDLGGLSKLDLHLEPLAWLIAAELFLRAPKLRLAGRHFFRGRERDQLKHDSWTEMGPPPKTHVRAGRYNRANVAVLYLASTVDGVRAELGSMPLCIQEYQPHGIRVADLTHPELSKLIGAAFDLAEGAGVNHRGPPDYVWPQFLASILAWSRVAGFVVPGVRGAAGSHYSNLVVFRPEHSWQQWSLREAGFKRDP